MEAAPLAKAKLSSAATKKQEQLTDIGKPDVERLAVDLAAVLQNPACPKTLFDDITDSLCEIQNEVHTLTPPFLTGLFGSPRKGVPSENRKSTHDQFHS